MRRPATIAFLAIALAALLAVALIGATQRRTLAFMLGVPSFGPVATLAPGATACQTPIPASTAFDAVELTAAARGGATRLAVSVRPASGGPPLGRGTLVAGDTRHGPQAVAVGHVPAGGEIAVCVRNAGRLPATLAGGPDVTARSSSAQLDGRPLGADIDFVFLRSAPRSTLALLPEMLRRAALFRAGWIGVWLYWLLLAAVAVGVPAALAVALRRASDHDSSPPRAD